MNNTEKKRLLWLFTLARMGLIFFFSMQNGETSSRVSGGLSVSIARQSCENFDGMPADMQQAVLTAASYSVRKAAHLSEYAVLGALLSLLIRCYGQRLWLHSGAAWIGAVFYAGTDELHQLFSSGRAARLSDVGIDSLGAFIGVAVVWFCLLFAAERKKSGNGK